jgi:PPK2 family polyphosphate:nucleotide phosphotransferase
MKIKIADYPTVDRQLIKDETKKRTKEILKEIGKLQYKMYAQNKFSLLIVVQGIDASGKDGLTRSFLKYCFPAGVRINSFKKPTDLEYAHDFLWRIHQFTPAKGEMQIFIRSHYEDILVPSVLKSFPSEVIERRFDIINNFEKLVESNDTRIIKFFLNVSKDVQKERLLERINLKKKHWKHKDGDWDTRAKFVDYLTVYEKILNKCNDIPWNIIPADSNWQKTFYASDAILKTLKELDLTWPELVSERFKQKTRP